MPKNFYKNQDTINNDLYIDVQLTPSNLYLLNTSNELNILPLNDSKLTDITLGSKFTCVMSNSLLNCRGDSPKIPHDIKSGTQTIKAGDCHICGLKLDRPFCIGCNGDDQLNIPRHVSDKRVALLEAGFYNSCAAYSDNYRYDSEPTSSTTQPYETNHIVCWGNNFTDQTNTPNFFDTITLISIGLRHICASTVRGYVKCWGQDIETRLIVPEIIRESSQTQTVVTMAATS